MAKENKLKHIAELWIDWARRHEFDPFNPDGSRLDDFYYDYLELLHPGLLNFKSADPVQDVLGKIRQLSSK